MGIPSIGEVVLVRFPFSDLSQTKIRPALCLADTGRGDWILCQITSNPFGDSKALPINSSDFAEGSLRVESFVRPGKLFTAHVSLVSGSVGKLKSPSLKTVIQAVVAIFTA